MAKKSKKCKKPQVTRTDNMFKCTWTKGSSKYKSQQFRYRVHYKAEGESKGKITGWFSLSVSKTAASKEVTIERTRTQDAKAFPSTVFMSDFYPNTGYTITAFEFRIRGKEKKKKYSSWKKKKIAFEKLGTGNKKILPPQITVTKDSSLWNKTQFKIKARMPSNGVSSKQWADQIQIQTKLTGTSVDTSSTDDGWIDYNPSGQTTPMNDTFGDNDLHVYSAGIAQTNSDWTVEITDPSSPVSAALNNDTTVIRSVRARLRGTMDSTDWGSGERVYGITSPPNNVVAIIAPNSNNGYTVGVDWNYVDDKKNPIENFAIQYIFAAAGSGGRPSGSTDGTTAKTVKPSSHDPFIESSTDQRRAHADFDVVGLIGDDNYFYVRVASVYGTSTKWSDWGLAKFKSSDGGTTDQSPDGILKKPTISSVIIGEDEDVNTIQITATNNSSIDDSFLVVRFIRVTTVTLKNLESSNDYINIGIMEGTGSMTYTFDIPWDASGLWGIGAICATGEYSEPFEKESADGEHSYEYYVVGEELGDDYNLVLTSTSALTVEAGKVPQAPSGFDAINITKPGDTEGKVKCVWNWASWPEANRCDIAWVDDEDKWHSSAGFSSTSVYSYQGNWRIINDSLELGKTYYFRARFVKELENQNGETASAWTSSVAVGLQSSPNIPVATVSPSVVVPSLKDRSTATLSWVYITTDTTEQQSVEIRYADDEGNVDETGSALFNLGSAEEPFTDQFVTLDSVELGWEPGDEYYLSLKVTSQSQQTSQDWSEPVMVKVADPISCTIDTTDADYPFVENDSDTEILPLLTELPMILKIDGAGDGAWTEIRITRADDCDDELPDGTNLGGYEGELVAYYVQKGDAKITLSQSALSGRLNDEGEFMLTARVYDSYGQSAIDEIPFIVRWAHQALMPVATVRTDFEELATFITILQPEGDVASDDFCEVYRLSADKSELIYDGRDFQFGMTIVDPYPTIGIHGGHRVVYKTANGDYNTADHTDAWLDIITRNYDPEEMYEAGDMVIISDRIYKRLEESEEPELWNPAHWVAVDDACDYIRSIDNIIDYDEDRVFLRYNVDLSNSWKKDFKETKYLGGAIQGDWNYAVSRTGTMSTVVVTDDSETISQMRELASYAGACHVRTIDGSNYTADVQVTENRNYSPGLTTSYSLTFTRIDAEGLEAMTEVEWNEIHSDE